MTVKAKSGVMIKDIPSALIEKKHIYEPTAVYLPFHANGFNEAIRLQGNVSLTLNRERLAAILYKAKGGHYDMLNEQDKLYCMTDSYQEADAIISELKDLLEVVNWKK